MLVVKVFTDFPYRLYDDWEQDIRYKAGVLSDCYVVFVDGEDNYVWFPTACINEVDSTYGHIITACDENIVHLMPVLCSPSVHMSSTIVDLVYDYISPDELEAVRSQVAGITIESMALGTILPSLQISNLDAASLARDETASLARDETASRPQSPKLVLSDDFSASVSSNKETLLPFLREVDANLMFVFKFVNSCENAACNYKLMSFVRQLFIQRGLSTQYKTIFHELTDIIPTKHNIIDLASEMMKCNLDSYNQTKYTYCNDLLQDIAAYTDSKPDMEYAICGLVYNILSDSVVTCTGRLWCFIDGVWQECSSDGYIWNFMTGDLIDYMLSNSAINIASHVKSVNTRGRMLRDIKLRLQNDYFETLLDSKKELIRMKNGVLNTETCILSKPVPSDYVSVRAGVPYNVFDATSRDMAQLMNILQSIFVHEDVLDFFITSCATFLEGSNPNKVFYIWWGTGNNAKSLIQMLVMKTFGEYCSTAPTSLITGKRASSSNATPELCHVEKRLVVFLQEPNPDEKIKAGIIKEMTGNDRMYMRQLFRSGTTMAFKAKIVLVCNNIIEVPGMDSALRRRVVVIPFTSTFLDQREYNLRSAKGTLNPDAKIIDPAIESKLLSCSDAFMYLLCKRYRESSSNFGVPQIIQDTTEDYLTRNNYQLVFIKRFLHTIVGQMTATTEIYEMFKDWFKRSYPGKRVADLEVFTTELTHEGYIDNGNGIIENIFVSYNGDLISHD